MHKDVIKIVQELISTKNQIPKTEGFAFAPVNFALIKYWGKRNSRLNLPMTSSLSLALPEKGAFTHIQCLDSDSDEYWLNQKLIDTNDIFAKRACQFLNLFRTKKNYHFRIVTQMNLPESSGLASSACGFAALTIALDQLFHWQLTRRELSILARLGSGSACRSLWSGFVEWQAGTQQDGLDSYAEPLEDIWNNLGMALLVLSTEKKPISSREAMQQTVATSCFYSAWPNKVALDLQTIKQAIRQKDFEQFGQICESNALAMHASMLTAWPPVFYWTPECLQAVQKIWQLRRDGLPLYFTQDAGPNLKLFFQMEHLTQIQAAFPEAEFVWPFRLESSNKEDDFLVIIDEKDRAKGIAKKMAVHEKALCHRAFSVFLFRKTEQDLELLIQQRHPDKYHCGNLWTNTCCSHPKPGESLLAAANRRLKEEIGVTVPLLYKGSFHYIATFENDLTENEIDHVFVAYEDPGNLMPNTNEIANLQWISVVELQKNLHDLPEKYTPWFKKALELALSNHYKIAGL